MKIVSKNRIYQIDIPSNYEYLEEGSSLNIYDSNSVGAISITSYYIPLNYDFSILKETLDFVKSIDETVILNQDELVCSGNDNCFTELIDCLGKCWKVWVYFKNNCAVFVTYNCDKNDKSVEIIDVNKILKSLKITYT